MQISKMQFLVYVSHLKSRWILFSSRFRLTTSFSYLLSQSLKGKINELSHLLMKKKSSFVYQRLNSICSWLSFCDKVTLLKGLIYWMWFFLCIDTIWNLISYYRFFELKIIRIFMQILNDSLAFLILLLSFRLFCTILSDRRIMKTDHW